MMKNCVIGVAETGKIVLKRFCPTMWAKPYNVPQIIETIDTGLPKQFKYSPLFKQPAVKADVDIELTGFRTRDYKAAERASGITHTPGSTVWHHAWKKGGSDKYKMQLVPFTVHQKTCPHAGGCKLWSIEHNNSPYRADSTVYVNESLQGKLIAGRLVYKTGVINVGASEKTYCDFVIDYIFEEKTLRHITVKSSYNHWRGKRLCGNRIWGLDPYGNLFLVNDDGQLFFWSHETMEVCPVGISERDILKQ